MMTHSSILAWEIPWTEEPGEPSSMGSQEVTTTTNLLYCLFTINFFILFIYNINYFMFL